MDVLRQPYPFYHSGKSLIRLFTLIFVIGFLFEYLLMPFPRNPDEHRFSYEIISLYHVGVAAFTYLIFFFCLSFIVQEDDWNIRKELTALFFVLLCIGFAEWAIRPIIYHNNGGLSILSLINEVWHAFLSGGLVYFLVTMVNLKIQARQNELSANAFSVIKTPNNNSTLNILTQNATDDFILNPKDLICAKAEGNYLELYLFSEGGTSKVIKRLTLLSLAEQLEKVDHILKTHRAYLVNMAFITAIEGNAQGYQLTLDRIDFKVPVSRKHLEVFKALV